jgi:hypothetical protein
VLSIYSRLTEKRHQDNNNNNNNIYHHVIVTTGIELCRDGRRDLQTMGGGEYFQDAGQA